MKKYILCGIFVTIVSAFSDIDARNAYYEDCECVAAYKKLSNKSELSLEEKDKKRDLEKCPCVEDYIKDQGKTENNKDGENGKDSKDSKDKDKKDDDKKNDDSEKEKSKDDKEGEDRAVNKAKDDYEDTKSKKRDALKRKSRDNKKEDEKENEDKDGKKEKEEKKENEDKDGKKDKEEKKENEDKDGKKDKEDKEKEDKDSKKEKEGKEAFNYLNSMPAQQLEKIINGLSSHGVLMTAEAETKEEPKKEKSQLLPKKYRINKKNSKKLIKELDKYRKIYS